MNYALLQQLKAELVSKGVAEDSAEVFARMYPFFLQYQYGINVPQMAKFLGRTEKITRRYMRQLEKKDVLVRLHYRAWTMSPAVKELI